MNEHSRHPGHPMLRMPGRLLGSLGILGNRMRRMPKMLFDILGVLSIRSSAAQDTLGCQPGSLASSSFRAFRAAPDASAYHPMIRTS